MVGMAGLIGAMGYFGSAKKQRKREREAFDKLDPTQMTQRQIWDGALKFGRKERLELRGELDQSTALLEEARAVCVIAEGLQKCAIMAADESVPQEVKMPIMEHWLSKFFTIFGLPDHSLDVILNDEKFLERLNSLQNAEEQRRNRQQDKRLKEAEVQRAALELGEERGYSCSFCGKSQKLDKVNIIAGPSVYICYECVDLCKDITKESDERKTESGGKDHPDG